MISDFLTTFSMDDRNTTHKRAQTTGPDCGSQDHDNLTAACAEDTSLKATHDGKAMASVYTVDDAHGDLCSTGSHVPEESSQMMQPKPPDKSMAACIRVRITLF